MFRTAVPAALALVIAAPASAQQIHTPAPVPAIEQTAEMRTILRVRLDEATLMQLAQPAQTIIIGNPAIADAIVHDGRNIVVTGKSFGTTNLIALNRQGQVIAERTIQVGQPTSAILTIQRGDALETYACAPTCRRTPMIGDTNALFTETLQQTQQRNGLAASQIGGAR